MKTFSGETFTDSKGVYIGPTCFRQFFADGTVGQLPKHDVSFIYFIKFPLSNHYVYRPQHCPSLCAFSKELEQHFLKPQYALKSLPGRDIADAV